MTHLAPESLVFMGVAGSGKSALGAAVAQRAGRVWLEGDDFHSEANRRKMAQGQPLTDDDRAGWLAALCEQLRCHPLGAMAACSALKRRYRDQLRQASPGLRFAFLDVDRAEARRRIEARGGHFFSVSLVDSQFETLESPVGEPGVLHLDALAPLDQLQAQVFAWLQSTA
ncbi:gluconokinase [Pelomonas sp. Root1237]|uniref:gluconokinase n=1 Tax=Pelomonas sp. Root1237 TaxID=1736434 RepID=UPI000B049D06|nr:gluconokinase [Pelomonas sp. Root1237]